MKVWSRRKIQLLESRRAYVKRSLLLITLAIFAMLSGTLSAPNGEELPGREVWLPETEVKDRFYSYLVGLIKADTCGVLASNDMERVLEGYEGKTQIPFELIREIRRACSPEDGRRKVEISFNGILRAPVPYSILGYHPGSVTASEVVKFYEWDIPRKRLRWSRYQAIELTNIYIFGIYEGWAIVDIDAWIDKLLGGLLDDTRIVVLALFKYKGEWHGLAAGYDPSGDGRSGIFNFSRNKILFPTPRELQILGPYFRNYVVRVKRVKPPLPPGKKWQPKL